MIVKIVRYCKNNPNCYSLTILIHNAKYTTLIEVMASSTLCTVKFKLTINYLDFVAILKNKQT